LSGHDGDFAEYVEENALLLYSTVYPNEEGKVMLSTLMTLPGQEVGELRQFYQEIDELRLALAHKIFGPSSQTFQAIKGYGLARSGLC